MSKRKSELNRPIVKRTDQDAVHASDKELIVRTKKKYLKQLLALQDEKSRMEHLILSLDIGAIIIDSKFKVRYVTPMGFMVFNLTESIIGRSIKILTEDGDYIDLIQDISAAIDNKSVVEKEIKNTHGDWKSLKIVPLIKKGYLTEGAIIMLMNLNDFKSHRSDHTHADSLKNAEELLYNMAHYDELTQLPNRASFIHLMMDIIDEATRDNSQFILMFMDLTRCSTFH